MNEYLNSRSNAGRSARSVRFALAALTVILSSLSMLVGCGGGDAGVLATVGDREVTAEYYQGRLAKLTEAELPVDKDGFMLDPESLESKLAFLDVIINKELMVLKAEELGYGQQEEISSARKAMIDMKSVEVMREDLHMVGENDITAAEVEDYHARRQEARRFQFIICNFQDDAEAARVKLLDGELWDDVAEQYNDGSAGPKNDYTMSLQYGMADDSFEQAIFSVEEGQISEPINSVYGYWIVRLVGIDPVRERPLDDEYRVRIRRIISQRRTKLNERNFVEEARQRHEFKMDEGALWTIFQGLPEKEDYINQETNQPVSKVNLEPLKIPAEELGRFFFSIRFDMDGEIETWTIGDYKAQYDQMSVFQRPKRNKMLGGVRMKTIADLIDMRLIREEAKDRGYMEDKRVVGDASEHIEKFMITRFHDEVVKIDEKVSAEDLAGFWAEHKQEYAVPESRNGRIVVCIDEESAGKARADLVAGEPWEEVYAAYSHIKDPTGKGAIDVNELSLTAEKDVVFALAEIGDVSAPFQARTAWCVIVLDEITPASQKEMKEVVNELAERIKRIRKDKTLTDMLATWRSDFGVQVNEKALAAVPSWAELQTAQ